MRRLAQPLILAACLVAAILACYWSALLRDGQFAYRDAAHYYYPLYLRVQQEWDAHRWPLWEPEENAGMPLLGNPTAAVLYPGKLIYAALPYAWGTRVYTVAHTVLAFVAMLAMLRSWGTSWAGSGIGALGYAFGAPILFQYCNIIFLVGAAWAPLGFRAVDRWLRLGRRMGLLELAVVLAMQTLGGDPESAYVMGVCAGGYAVALAWLRGRGAKGGVPVWLVVLAAALVVAASVPAVLALAAVLPAYRPRHIPPVPLPWMRWVPPAVAGLWGAAGLMLVVGWLRRGRRPVLVPMLAGLAGSAVLAATLSAAQLLPVMEFTGQSGRAAWGGPHDIYPFSLEPVRLIEMVWPNAMGTMLRGNRSWLMSIPPVKHHAKIWVPSLYLGGLTIVLALGSLGFRGGTPVRGWLSAVAIVSLLASFGEYGSPIWWARWDPSIAARIGPHDKQNTATFREDGQLRDGDGSPYWLLATVLPGFRQFRFPSKLLSFTALALAGLAGIGWDRVMEGRRARTAALAGVLLALSLAALAVVIAERGRLVAALEADRPGRMANPFGPLDAPGAIAETRNALIQGACAFAIALALALGGRRRPGLAGAVALVVLAVDVAAANAKHVVTVPQSVMEQKPRVLELIEKAEREASQPAATPFRVHRMPYWDPVDWYVNASSNRVGDFVAWERSTLQPKYAIPYGTQYTWTLGVAELYDYDWYFGAFLMSIDREVARRYGAKSGEKVVVFPRRAFDLWNTRYFIVPSHPNGWADESRGYIAFLEDTDVVYPPPGAFDGPGGEQRRTRWLETEDVQILRNLHCFPRAWLVHEARPLKPIVGLERTDREGQMEEILFENDHFWLNPDLHVHDPRKVAWIDSDKWLDLAEYRPGGRPTAAEAVTIARYGPQRVELEAVLERPGLVVLSDTYYPGWKLTIDGEDAPVYRANRLMRGAAVPSGRHRLVYTYEPRSFYLGTRISLAGLAAAALLGLAFVRRPVSAALAGPESWQARPAHPASPEDGADPPDTQDA